MLPPSSGLDMDGVNESSVYMGLVPSNREYPWSFRQYFSLSCCFWKFMKGRRSG